MDFAWITKQNLIIALWEPMDESQIIFEIDFFLWSNLLILLKKNRQKTAKNFALKDNVVNLILGTKDLPSRLSGDTFLSFTLEQDGLFFSRKIFPEADSRSLLKSSLTFIDISYWTALKNLASLDIDGAVVSFGLPRNLVEWTLSASCMDLYRIAIGTTDRIALRYRSSVLEELLTADSNDEYLLCKKTILSVQGESEVA